MALVNPPAYLQNVSTYTAQIDRIAASGAIMPEGAGMTWRDGVRGYGDLLVSAQTTPNMTVAVAAGIAHVEGTNNLLQGLYVVSNDASVNVTITTANATLARNDLIIARIQDSFYSGATNTATLEVVTGTAASTPADPTPPANSLILARVVVAAGVTSITAGNVIDLRKWSAAIGGTVPCKSTTRPAIQYPGLSIYEIDTGRKFISDGVSFVQTEASSSWQTWSGGVSNVPGSFTRSRFVVMNKTCIYQWRYAVSGAGTGSTVSVSIPVQAHSSYFSDNTNTLFNDTIGNASVIDASSTGTAQGAAILLNDSAVTFRDASGNEWVGTGNKPVPWASGDILSGTVTYEIV